MKLPARMILLFFLSNLMAGTTGKISGIIIDQDTGEIYDIPWDRLQVKGEDKLKDFEILESQVILRGRRKKR